MGQGDAAVLRGGSGRLVRTHPAGHVDRVEGLVDEGLAGRHRLGAAEVGQVDAGVGGVELAGDVGMGLAVTHEQKSHGGS